MASSGTVAAVDTVEDFGPGKSGQAKRWKAELDAAKKAEEKFVKSGELTVKRYRYERDATEDGVRKYAILWANVQTLRPAIYAKPPEPEVSRRFDTNNQVNRVAALIMERNLHYTVCEHSMFDATLKQCVEDRLLPGRGVAWVRYVADMRPMYAGRPSPLPETPPAPAGAPAGPISAPTAPPVGPPGMPPANEPMPGSPVEPPPAGPPPTQPPLEQLPPGPLPMAGAAQPTPLPLTPPQDPALQNKAVTDDSYESQVISGERVCFDYVYWKDFRMSPSRTWEECCWVARRVYMTREVGEKRFGAMFKGVPLNYSEPKNDEAGRATTTGSEPVGPGKSVLKKAAIWEIWSKDDLKVYWLCEDHPEILDVRDDLFQLDDFYPCPKPLLATTTSDSTVPIPDYRMYQDQAEELDILTQRISKLMQAVKVVGVYDKSQDGVQRMLNEGNENGLVPVDNWAMFAERGGLKGVVDWLPVQQVMEVLTKLIEARSVVKQDIYEITGIADIVRGASVATETATAQAIKERFANIRISDLQKDVARFASDLINMTAQLMTNFFQPETLVINADLADPQGPDFQYVPAAVQLVKDGKLIQHKISVSVDAITEEDDKEQKAERSEFLDRFSNFLQQSSVAMQQMPQIGPLLGHIMLWTVRGFKVGRDIEGVLEQQIEQMSKAGPPQQPPDPAQVKAQAEAAKAQSDQQMEMQKAQADQQMQMQKMQMDAQSAQAESDRKMVELQAQLAADRERGQLELQMMREKNAAEIEAILMKAKIEAETAQMAMVQKAQATAVAQEQSLSFKQAAHEQAQEQAAEAGNAALERNESAARQKEEGE